MKQLKIKLPLRTMALAGGLLLATSSFAQNNAVKGHVTDASGEPVMGATITIKGKAVGITDIDGNFSIDAAPGTELTFTFLGMSPQTVKASGNMSVTLASDDKLLNEVVVIGYGPLSHPFSNKASLHRKQDFFTLQTRLLCDVKKPCLQTG